MDSKPNFLIFVVDQMQSYSLGCNGNADVKTPNIDSIARQGITFQRAYVSNPVCMPSRSTLLTGLTPRQHGCITNGTKLPETTPTLTEALRSYGYRTHAVGKLHLQPTHAPIPGDGVFADDPRHSWECKELWDSGAIQSLPEPYYGFDTVDYVGGHGSGCFGTYGQWADIADPGLRAAYARDAAYQSGPHETWRMEVPAHQHYNSWIADRSVQFIQESAGSSQPFLLWCSFPDPHHPYAATRPYSEMYDPSGLAVSESLCDADDRLPQLAARRNQLYPKAPSEEGLQEIMAQTYGMISHVDDSIGRVLDSLERSGAIDNTVVVFLADHGEYLGCHGLLRKAEWCYEELVRVPFVWSSPNSRLRPQSLCNDVVSLLDFVPTILDYAGVSESEIDRRGVRHATPIGLPGRSLKDCLDSGSQLQKRPALIEYDEDWHPGPSYRVRAIVDGTDKLVLYPATGGGMLFDLEHDPHEMHDRFNDVKYRDVRYRLTERLLIESARSDRLDQPRICGA